MSEDKTKKKTTISAIERARLTKLVSDDVESGVYKGDLSSKTWVDIADNYAVRLGKEKGSVPVSAVKTGLTAFEVPITQLKVKSAKKDSKELTAAKARIKQLEAFILDTGHEVPSVPVPKEETVVNPDSPI